jgi:hypothetical protein
MNLLAVAALSLAFSAERAKTFPAASLKLLDIDVSDGPIRVAAAEADTVSVTVVDDDPEKCEVKMGVEGDRLVLQAKPKRRGWFSRGRCKTGFEVLAPRALGLTADAGTGDVKVAGLKGEIEVDSGTGDVVLEDTGSRLDIDLGTGDVSGTTRAGSAKVDCGTGRVDLRWLAAPEGEIDVDAGTGKVTLSFPEKTALRTSLHSGAGEVESAFASEPGAKARVSVDAGAGDVALKKFVER